MADLKEFLLSDQFKEYHRRQAELIAEVLHGLLTSLGLKPDIEAAMNMARKINNLPLNMYDDKQFKDIIRTRLRVNDAVITATLARKFLETE
jgi:hypothetical protein